jgi:predicted ATPase
MLQQAPVLNGHSSLQPQLHLPSLEIKGFRSFRHLRIERLGRVNLIVGKNGVGKSSVLEALRLYATYAKVDTIDAILAERSENVAPLLTSGSPRTLPLIETISSLRHLLYQRKDFVDQPQSIQIGPQGNAGETLTITFRYHPATRETSTPIEVTIELGNQSQWGFSYLATGVIVGIASIYAPMLFPCSIVSAHGVDEFSQGRFWDQIALTEAEAEREQIEIR